VGIGRGGKLKKNEDFLKNKRFSGKREEK